MWLARGAAPLATAFARVSGTMPLFTRESLHALRNHLNVSHDRAARELGYDPRPLEHTIRDSFAWFKEANAL
jgi:dihydroflavonol-4-reductase